MNSNNFNIQTSFEEISDMEMIDECPSINKLSRGWVHKNPLLTNKGKVYEKDIQTFRENHEKSKRSSIINFESCAVPLDFSPSNSDWNESSDLSNESGSESGEPSAEVFWVKVNQIVRKPRSIKFSNEMSSKEILQMIQ